MEQINGTFVPNGTPTYQCHKKVRAFKIGSLRRISPDRLLILSRPDDGLQYTVEGDWARKHNPLVGGYVVVYEDGYTSYSPAEAFESGYTLINDNTGKTMGQVAYEARCAAGRKIPGDWNSMDKFEKIMWEDTASIITAEVLARFKQSN